MSSAVQSRPWSVHRLPRADGKTFLVTGGNAGIGYFVAEQLAGTGATVVLGSRDAARAEAAMVPIRSRVPDARVRRLRLTSPTCPHFGPAWTPWRWTAWTRWSTTPGS